MKIIETKILSSNQKEQIRLLWNKEYPAKLKYSSFKSFEEYLNKIFIYKHSLLVKGEYIYGWYFEFLRDENRWFGILLDSSIHGKGWGNKLMQKAKKENTSLTGWVVDKDDVKANGEVYRSPLEFYKKLGFDILEDQRLETEKMSAVKIRFEKDSIQKTNKQRK